MHNMVTMAIITAALHTTQHLALTPIIISHSDGPQGTGVYSVEVYDIESDGGVSSVGGT